MQPTPAPAAYRAPSTWYRKTHPDDVPSTMARGQTPFPIINGKSIVQHVETELRTNGSQLLPDQMGRTLELTHPNGTSEYVCYRLAWEQMRALGFLLEDRTRAAPRCTPTSSRSLRCTQPAWTNSLALEISFQSDQFEISSITVWHGRRSWQPEDRWSRTSMECWPTF